nr:copia protein [Tanacetum cinerariifolium]
MLHESSNFREYWTYKTTTKEKRVSTTTAHNKHKLFITKLRISMGYLPRSAYLGSLSLTQFPEFNGPWECLEIRDYQLWIGINLRNGERARTTGFEFAKENHQSGVKEEDSVTDVKNTVLDFLVMKPLSIFRSKFACLRASRPCAPTQQEDDKLFRKPAYMEYIQSEFCKRFGGDMGFSNDSQMHNNIMAAGSRDRPPMLAPGRYPQWRSRFLQYVHTRPNGEVLRKCILSGPYKPTTVLVHAIEATDDSPAVPEHTTDVKTNLFWEFRKFTSHDEESIESYYTRFYKLMNEMIRNNLTVTTMQVNVQFLQQLQPEWSREVAKPITPPSETTFEEDNDPEQAQRDKDMQKNLALIAKYFKQIYKPTNNNLRTSSNFKNKNVDTTPRKSEQYDWLVDTDEEVDEQELEAHYSYMAKIQKVPNAGSCIDSEPVEQVQNDTGYNVFSNDLQHSKQSESVSNTCLVETDDSNVTPDSPDMCEDDIQNDQNDAKSDDERVALANLIANLKLDIDENKKIQKQLKKANTTLAQELKECKTILAETSKSLGESISV